MAVIDDDTRYQDLARMPDLSGYTLTFDDEFNALSVSQSGIGSTWADIRTPNRLTSTSDGGFGDSDAAFVDPASGINPFIVRNGAVTIQATPSTSPVVGSKHWASGILTSQASFSQTYGYFEMRAAFPQQVGAWPAFWLLREDNTPVVELDAAEAYGSSSLYSTVHSNRIPGGFQSDLSDQPSQATGFHTYGVAWNSKDVSFFYDGKLTSKQTTPSDMNSPMYLIADLSVQDLPGLTQAPKTMSIDYIRAFSNDPNARSVFLGAVSSPDGRMSADLDGATARGSVVCFASGTLIRTDCGDVAVEALAIGNLVVTASGARRPVRWLGSRTIDCHRHPRPHEAMPVRVAAQAFGDDRPSRDLLVSPGHSLCIDIVGEVLIPAGALVNGTTISQEDVERVTYWHVELEGGHDILLAENMPAESYVEMGNREFFANGGVVDLGASPDAPVATHADFCRPFHAEGVLVDAVRAQLSVRSQQLGWRLEDRGLGDLHLVVDGKRIDPLVRGLSARFHVPADARDVWVVSSTSVPADMGDSSDRRALGVMLSSLSIDDGFGEPCLLSAEDPRLSVGFYGVERGEGASHRWTAGRAMLPAGLWDRVKSDFYLRIELARPALPRWVAPPLVVDAVLVNRSHTLLKPLIRENDLLSGRLGLKSGKICASDQ